MGKRASKPVVRDVNATSAAVAHPMHVKSMDVGGGSAGDAKKKAGAAPAPKSNLPILGERIVDRPDVVAAIHAALQGGAVAVLQKFAECDSMQRACGGFDVAGERRDR